MLNTKPETVRRWIRNGKLHAEKTSRKDGLVVTEEDLNEFLKSSPKYASMATVAGLALGPIGIVTLPLLASFLAMKKKSEMKDDISVSDEEIKKYLQEEIDRRTQSINHKIITIEQLQREITNDKQKIAEYKLVLSQLEGVKE